MKINVHSFIKMLTLSIEVIDPFNYYSFGTHVSWFNERFFNSTGILLALHITMRSYLSKNS